MKFKVKFITAGTHYIWGRMYMSGSWQWLAKYRLKIEIPSAEVRNVSIWEVKDFTELDRIIITNDSTYTPNGEGPPESPRN